MKRATLTPNRFITCIPNWWVNGFVLFAFFFILDGCVDETSLTGFKKEPRMEVKFTEFEIPAVTVQADSLNSGSWAFGGSNDRLLCGKIQNPGDPNFGTVVASIFTQFLPYSGKISGAGRTGFVLNKLTFNVVLDQYVYGDTLDSPSTFSLHEITGNSLASYDEYYTNSVVNYDPTPISTASYQFKTTRFRRDSISKYQTLNGDADVTNNVYDSLTFEIPIQSTLAKALFDTLRGKGFYSWRKYQNEDTLVFNYVRTDSAFLKAFKGLAIIPESGDRVLGFTSILGAIEGSTRLTLSYSYLLDGVATNGTAYYFIQNGNSSQFAPRFSQIQSDRSATPLSGLPPTAKYLDYNAPDGYCYVQGGTGLFTKLDFRAVIDTFNLYNKIAFNSAELIIPIEPNTLRPHYRIPKSLQLRITKDNARFLVPPQIPMKTTTGGAVMGPDPIYGQSYYSISNESYLDVRSDEGDYVSLTLRKDANGQFYYGGYIAEYLQYSTILPSSLMAVNYLSLTAGNRVLEGVNSSSDVGFGRSLDGISFKKDQVKLRVFYSVPK